MFIAIQQKIAKRNNEPARSSSGCDHINMLLERYWNVVSTNIINLINIIIVSKDNLSEQV